MRIYSMSGLGLYNQTISKSYNLSDLSAQLRVMVYCYYIYICSRPQREFYTSRIYSTGRRSTLSQFNASENHKKNSNMHVPKDFEISSKEDLHEIIESAPLAQLVTYSENGLSATPVPVFLNKEEGEYGTIYGHLARKNKQIKDTPIGDAMLIFQGPNGYISPSWTQTKKDTGKMVPTWNYTAVHAFGPVEYFTDKKRLYEVVDLLTQRFEPEFSDWEVSDAPKLYTELMLSAITGFRIPIVRFEASKKLSQNKSAADQNGLLSSMKSSDIRDIMEKELTK